jgi:hypothetical protein
VTAIRNKGLTLWTRDPFKYSHLQPYRVRHPKIRFIGEAAQWELKCCARYTNHRYVEIEYDSTQFGMVDEETGDFIILGEM